MKKRLAALVLAVCLVCSMVVSASAETVYMMLYDFLSDPDSGYYYLGTPGSMTLNDSGLSYVMLTYSAPSNGIILLGKNADGIEEYSAWSDVDDSKGISVIYFLSSIWSTLEGSADPDLMIVLEYQYGSGEGEAIDISTADDARQFVETV